MTGKVLSAKKSASGKSINIDFGGKYLNVGSADMEKFEALLNSGKAIPVQVRTQTQMLPDGSPVMETFSRRNGTQASAIKVTISYWFDTGSRSIETPEELKHLLGAEATDVE